MQILNCAETLGQYHRAMADVQIDGDGWGIVSLSRHHLDVLNEAVAERQFSEEDKRQVRQTIVQLYEMLTIADERMESLGWSDLDTIPVHGDYHQFNCRFEGDQVAAMVDFDNSRLEPRIYDVAYAMDMMLGLDWRREPEEEYLWRDARLLRPEIIGPWMTAYSRYAPPLSAAEIRLLPWVCAAVWPEAIHGFLPKTAEEMPGCERVAECMRYLLGNAVMLSRCIEQAVGH
jgi:Ser/Thr protein kinase RdoA (MazF antagonist)